MIGLGLTVALIVTLTVVAGLMRAGDVVGIDSYRLADDSVVLIDVTAGPGWTRVTNIRESEESIVVTVQSLNVSLWAQAAVAQSVQLSIVLAAPLGGRAIFDATGHRVPLYRPPES
jgi:hypothetical protein